MLRGDLVTVRLAIMSIACALFLGSQACTPCNDLDGDGYGNPASPLCANPAPDCDDDDAARNPGETEGPFGDATCGDTIDNDCNLVADLDEPKCDEDDLNMTAQDFACILGWSQVPEPPPGATYFFTNLRGHLTEATQAASSPTGGAFPPGTIIQLLPDEAMVKRAPGWSPLSNDWEFFRLQVSAAGTLIVDRGVNIRNPLHPAPCIQCHTQADPQWDFVCGDSGIHGCDPLPPFITDELIGILQQSDPRCP